MKNQKKPKSLNDLIEKYPKIFKLMEEGYYRISSDIPSIWVPIIDILCKSIQSRIDNVTIYDVEDKHHHPPQLECEQIKEKYGELRFDARGGDDQMEGMIEMAVDMCWDICTECGTHENLGTTQVWVERLCKTCFEKSTYKNWIEDE